MNRQMLWKWTIYFNIEKSMLDLAFVWYEEYLIVMQISEGVFHLADKTLFSSA